MKTYINDMKIGETIESYFMVKNMAIKVANNGNSYGDFVLQDKTGEASAKLWDLKGEAGERIKGIKERDLIKVRGIVADWNGGKQIKVLLLRKALEDDLLEIGDFVRTSPMKDSEMLDYILMQINDMKCEDYKKICLALLEENKEKLMYYPAAVKNHHAERSGLLYHMRRMIENGIGMCNVYEILDKELLICGVIIHDIAKLEEMDADNTGIATGYTFEGQLLGHLIQGIKILNHLCERLGITKETEIMLEHMVLSHHYEPEFGSPKKPLFPEAEILHYLDMIDARMYDMEEALKKVQAGEFTEKIWTMENRRLYKPRKSDDSKM